MRPLPTATREKASGDAPPAGASIPATADMSGACPRRVMRSHLTNANRLAIMCPTMQTITVFPPIPTGAALAAADEVLG